MTASEPGSDDCRDAAGEGIPGTALDLAHRAMSERPDDQTAQLAFYQRLADSALVLLLDDAPDADGRLTPTEFTTADGAFVLAFDDDARLAAFVGGPAHFAAMPGRQILRILSGQGVGLGVNLGCASETLVPAEAVTWLAGILDAAPVEVARRPRRLGPPRGAGPALLAALDAKLAAAGGLAETAYLCGTAGPDGGGSLLLVYVGAPEPAEPALAKAAGEALAFSGSDLAALDVAFAAPGDALAAQAAGVGLRFDLPRPVATAAPARPAPGSDPARPPILR